MYKNTKSTNRISVEKKKLSTKAHLEKVYQSSWTIFVERKIVHPDDFGNIPTQSIASLISENKKYLAKKGFHHTEVDKLPDWFLFHPRINMLIRSLKEVAKTKPHVIPFELSTIAFNEKSKNKKIMFPTKISNNPNERQKTVGALALAFKKASEK